VVGKPIRLTCLVVAWLVAVASGFIWLSTYQAAAGRPALAPADWPAGSAILPENGRFTLILFAHPRCPCTRASLDGLSWVLARSQGKANAYVVFVQPAGAPDAWERTSLRDEAAAVPGVRVLSDVRGSEAGLFGAATSGETVLYDAQGRLVFRGGLTAGRGHAGDSAGRRALVACLAGAASERRDFPVYGCPLLDSD
jgi:hypothetical protein